MKVAIGLPVAVPGTRGRYLVEWARLAEAAGFSSLGTIGRTVFDSHEELVALAAAAGATERIGLATTVMISPVRDPVLLAKQAATLDAISTGRLTLGLGVGWREDDFRASGVPFEHRGTRLEEQLEVMRTIWRQKPLHEGVGVIGPTPVRPGGPEIVLGGTSERALRRAGRLADGFLAPPVAAEGIRRMYDVVIDAAREARRKQTPRLLAAGYFALGDAAERGAENMSTYYRAGGAEFVRTMVASLMRDVDKIRETAAALQEIGVDEVFLWPAVADLEQVEMLEKAVH